jgi:O-antigen/teichoic acid export membrane protein
MRKEGTGALVVRNTLANGLGTFSGVLLALVLTPFLIQGLGEEGFGIWALALSLSFLGGYASLADLGVETSAARYVAEARSDGDAVAASETASSAMAFFGAVALVATPLLAALAFPLTDLFGVDEPLRDEAVACFALMAAQLVFELPARVFFAAVEGAQRYDVYQLIEFARSLTQAALFTVALVFDLGLPGLGGAVVVSSFVVLVLGRIAAKRIVPEVTIGRRHVSKERFRSLLTFGSQYFLVRVMGTIYRQVDKVIVAIALGLRPVTFYEIANRIHQGAAMVQSVAASSLLPATAYLRRDRETLRELYLRGTTYTVAVALPVVVSGFVFAEDLIRTWVGEALTDSAGSARLFLVFVAFVTVHAVGAAMIVALGHMRFVIGVTLAFTLVNLVVSIALVKPLGVDGVILGTLVAQAAIWLPYTLFFFRRFDVAWNEWLRRVVGPNLPGLALQAATAIPLLELAHASPNLAVTGLIALLSVLVSLAAFIGVGLRERDRRLLYSALSGALRRGAESTEPAGAQAAPEAHGPPPKAGVSESPAAAPAASPGRPPRSPG